MKKIRIFLVDDHAFVRDGLHMLLNAESDMEVVGEAAEGNGALIKIPQLKPNVVIMDLSMPNGRDGLPTTSEITQFFPDISNPYLGRLRRGIWLSIKIIAWSRACSGHQAGRFWSCLSPSDSAEKSNPTCFS